MFFLMVNKTENEKKKEIYPLNSCMINDYIEFIKNGDVDTRFGRLVKFHNLLGIIHLLRSQDILKIYYF